MPDKHLRAFGIPAASGIAGITPFTRVVASISRVPHIHGPMTIMATKMPYVMATKMPYVGRN